jgi:thymidylate synthase (FAD)
MKKAKLKVLLLKHTPNPEETVAMAARLCYSPADITALKDKIEVRDQREFVRRLVRMGHMTPIEHVSFTFVIEGISRACSHQLVRHRVASYSQQSQRYVSEADGFEFVLPPTIEADPELKRYYVAFMKQAQEAYNRISQGLNERGITGEAANQDARFVLPNATETKIMVSMNARELMHFFRLRCCNRAQWEIRAMAEKMLFLAKKVAPVIFEHAGPGCLYTPCPEGEYSCGKVNEVRARYGVKKDRKA